MYLISAPKNVFLVQQNTICNVVKHVYLHIHFLLICARCSKCRHMANLVRCRMENITRAFMYAHNFIHDVSHIIYVDLHSMLVSVWVISSQASRAPPIALLFVHVQSSCSAVYTCIHYSVLSRVITSWGHVQSDSLLYLPTSWRQDDLYLNCCVARMCCKSTRHWLTACFPNISTRITDACGVGHRYIWQLLSQPQHRSLLLTLLSPTLPTTTDPIYH